MRTATRVPEVCITSGSVLSSGLDVDGGISTGSSIR
jgi:hypothetical protein